jgi:hypothetical protein
VNRCRWCGAGLLFVKVRDGADYYCNAEHMAAGRALQTVSSSEVVNWMERVHRGACPKCGGDGPIDVHMSYQIYSLIFATSWKDLSNICCRKCGLKAQCIGLTVSLFLGWWGFPWGIAITPIQIVKNLWGMLVPPDREVPSKRLEAAARLQIVQMRLEGVEARHAA